MYIEKFIKLFLELLLEDIGSWLTKLNKLQLEIPVLNEEKYNLYARNNKLEKLINDLTEFLGLLNEMKTMIDLQPNMEDLLLMREYVNSASKYHQELQKRFLQNRIFLSREYRAKLVFPIPKDSWARQDSHSNEKYSILTVNEGNSTVGKIELNKNYKTNYYALFSALEEIFGCIEGLDYLDLSGNELDDVAIQLLVNAINQQDDTYRNISLSKCEVLILSCNLITKNGMEILLKALYKKPSIRQLLLNNNHIHFDFVFFRETLIRRYDTDNGSNKLVNVDLSLNFIPEGYLFTEYFRNRNVYIYHSEDELMRKLSQLDKLGDKDCIKKCLFSDRNGKLPLRSLCHEEYVTDSLVASQDSGNRSREISYTCGVIGLFAVKPRHAFFGEHAYLMVEGISEFGQRFLIRGDLFSDSAGKVLIQITHCPPKDFLEFTGNGENIYCRTGRFNREEINKVLAEMCRSRDTQDFMNYSIIPNEDLNTHNCLSWAARMLKRVVAFDAGFCPSRSVRRNVCPIL